MTAAVFAIHGIANRDPEEFAERVRRLAGMVGHAEVHPVFWGDLGADHRYVEKVVPGLTSDSRFRTRSDGTDPGEYLIEALTWSDMDSHTTRVALELLRGDAPRLAAETRIEYLLEGLRVTLDSSTGHGHGTSPQIRDEEIIEAVEAAVVELWADPQLALLWQIDDRRLLNELGASVAVTVLELAEEDPLQLRAPSLRAVVEALLRGADRTAAVTMGTMAAHMVSWVRLKAGPWIAKNVGDLIVYQRSRAVILQTVRDRIAEIAGDFAGRDDAHRIHLVGHSLGAVVAMDLATDAQHPVYTESIVTFGSQWPLLQMWAPSGSVAAYNGDAVRLPDTVRRWVNLWERLDPLAFLAAPVFELHSGDSPQDIELSWGYGDTLFSHSVYWESPQLHAELARVWRSPSEPTAAEPA